MLLAVGGLAFFLAAYSVYARFLGPLDGLPPLPEKYLPGAPIIKPPPWPPGNPCDGKLRMAFGEGSPQLKRLIKLEANKRNAVLAIDEYKIIKATDEERNRIGQVRLKPFSVAIFSKPEKEAAYPEISTINCKLAYLQFDQPVTELKDLSNRKVVAAEFLGPVEIVNNHRTARTDDDLFLFTKGIVFFNDKQHLICTESDVAITDYQSKPKPITINGKGMEVWLTTESKTPTAKPGEKSKPKQESITGVDKVQLRADVDMHLWTDSGFLGDGGSNGKSKAPAASAKPAAPVQAQSPPEKAEVIVRTEGPFWYYHQENRATFDVPAPDSKNPLAKYVDVTRVHPQKKYETLICDRLELKFRPKKSGEKKAEPANREESLEIDWAHATGTQLTLTSDLENLVAYGSDLKYFSDKRRTILTGNPSKRMKAIKDGHEIDAEDLTLESDGAKEVQHATARGPGEVHLLDRNTNNKTSHAHWQDLMTYSKDGEFDLLTLTGKAKFEDTEHKQNLQGDRLKVWLKPADTSTPLANDQQRLKPHHLEAVGHVTASSAELFVDEPTEQLVIWFKDLPGSGAQPAAAPERTGSGAAAAKSPAPAAGPAAAAPTAKPAAAPPEKPKKPIRLSAGSVEAHVTRAGEKNDLDKLWCRGNVVVHQEPSGPEEKGVDIRGDTMQLTHFVEGNLLLVTGKEEPGKEALVRQDKTTIIGPEITIDQRTNNARVEGIGAMQMPAKTNLNGEALAKPEELTIHWNKAMFFNGNFAEFHGGVLARQGTGRLQCQDMQVFLDKPVSFKEGEKRDTAAKVKNLICDRSVLAEDVVRQGNQFVKYNRLTAPEMSMDNEDSTVTAEGPGTAYLLQLGDKDERGPRATPSTPAPAQGTPKSPARPQELKLTRVNYRSRLRANNKAHTAKFYDDVEVVHMPANDPDIKIDLDKPPEGCMTIRCQKLSVRKLENTQEMDAQNKVEVHSKEFWAICDVMHYDEATQKVIFEGAGEGYATLYKQENEGGPFKRVVGKKIIYMRSNGQFHVEGGKVLGDQ